MTPQARRAAWCGLALAACIAAGPGARATCPAPESGEALPPEAQAEFLMNLPWRDRLATLERDRSGVDLSAVRLLFLGDSITEAWEPTIFAAHFGGLHALNWGARGETTQGLLWRLPRMPFASGLRPALIVLLIGTNDTWPGGDPRRAAIGVGEVVGQLRRLAPSSRILLLGLLPRGPDDTDPWRRMAMAMNGLIAACADGSHVFFADPGRDLVDPAGRLSPEIAGDYLHPTAKGYLALAAALDPAIRRLLVQPDR